MKNERVYFVYFIEYIVISYTWHITYPFSFYLATLLCIHITLAILSLLCVSFQLPFHTSSYFDWVPWRCTLKGNWQPLGQSWRESHCRKGVTQNTKKPECIQTWLGNYQVKITGFMQLEVIRIKIWQNESMKNSEYFFLCKLLMYTEILRSYVLIFSLFKEYGIGSYKYLWGIHQMFSRNKM